ncbi:MAG: ferritin family protein [bacterium]|nr:ferritin family protein [bacterium]
MSTTAKTLIEAIKNEIEGRAFYLALAKKVKNPLVRRKILGLAEDELEHRETLSRLYWAQTGSDVGDLASYEVHVDIPEVESMSVTDLLVMAMNTEKETSETYLRMSEATGDTKASAFLEYLSDFEQAHYETLAGELEKIRSTPGWEDQGYTE